MRKKVLIVDDSATVRQQVGLALRHSNYEVLEANGGLPALELLRKHPDCKVVVSDVNMPGMDGLELLAAVRNEPGRGDVAVLMLTTEGQPELLDRAKLLGAKGWLVKPFKPDFLLNAVRKFAGA